jgi:Tfp pilus assembly protein PilV
MISQRPFRVTRRRGQRGLSLIEVLVAFFLLFVVTLAILEMLSMAYIVNQATEMRTELTYKAQLVVEQVRLQSVLDVLNGTTNTCCPLEVDDPFVITDQSNTCFDSY